MLFILLYLCVLMIAPQLWLEPFVGWRTDVMLYPMWLLYLVVSGRALDLVRFRSQDWLMLGFMSWMFLSMSMNKPSPWVQLVLISYPKWFVLYRFVVATLPSLARVRTAMMILLFFGMVLTVEGLQHAFSDDGRGWAGQDFAWMDDQAAAAGLAGRTRWVNIFDGPGVFCVVYTITLPVALVMTMPPFGMITRISAMVMTAMLLAATYYTGSRGGFLATVGVFGLFMLTRIRITPPRVALAGAVLGAAILLAPSHLTSTSDSHGSAQHRVSMWGQGIEMISQNPLFGIGRGNFAPYTGSLIAHNSGIEIMGETGFPGIFMWLGMLYMCYRNLFAAYKGLEDPKARAFMIAAGLSLAGYMFSSLFVTLEYETMYFLMGVCAAAGRHAKVPPPFRLKDAMLIGGLVVAFFLVVKSFVMLYF